VAVQRAAGDAGNGLPIYDGLAVERHCHHPPDQRDVERLPLARLFGRIYAGREKAVDAAERIPARTRPLVVFDLNLVSPAQVETAVRACRIPELDMQLEIVELLGRDQVRAATGIAQHAVLHRPVIFAALRLPSCQAHAVEKLSRLAPSGRAFPMQRRSAPGRPGTDTGVITRDRSRKPVSLPPALELQVAVFILGRQRETQRSLRELDARDRTHAAHRADEPAHEGRAGTLNLQPGVRLSLRGLDGNIPRPHRLPELRGSLAYLRLRRRSR